MLCSGMGGDGVFHLGKVVKGALKRCRTLPWEASPCLGLQWRSGPRADKCGPT